MTPAINDAPSPPFPACCQGLTPTRYERCIRKEHRIPRPLRALIEGTARATRLALPAATEDDIPLLQAASGVLAPIAFFFVHWVLRRAEKNGFRRLYFLARDGLVMKKVAEILARYWRLGVEIRYLHCSRQSLCPPSFSGLTDFSWYWISWGYLQSITWAEIRSRLQLGHGSLGTALQKAGLGHLEAHPHAPLSDQELASIKQLLETPEARRTIQKALAAATTSTLAYLEQEGLFDGIPYAVVDTGWKGTSQYALSLLLSKAGRRPAGGLTGYYLGLNRERFSYPGDRLHAFLFDWTQEPRDYRLYNFLCFELLFAAGHGRTLAYRSSQNGTVLPVLGKNDSHLNRIASIQHRCACTFATHLAAIFPAQELPDTFSEMCKKLARMFIGRPDPAEAAIYGACRIASEMQERDQQELAPPMTYAELVTIITGRRKIRGFWPQGSMARSRMHPALWAYGLFLDLRLLEWYRRVFLRY